MHQSRGHRSRSHRSRSRRSRSPRSRVEMEEAFSMSSLSDCDLDNNDKSAYSKFNRKHEEAEVRKRYSRDQNNKNDRSRRNSSDKTGYFHHQQNTCFFADNPLEAGNSDFQVAPAHKSPLSDKFIRHKRSNDGIDFSERRRNEEVFVKSKRAIIDNRNRTDTGLAIDLIDYGNRFVNDPSSYNIDKEITNEKMLGQTVNKSDDRINRLEKMVELLVQDRKSSSIHHDDENNQGLEIGNSSTFFQTTTVWLNKINEECLERNFDEITCINFIQTKMSGIMKAWFKTVNPYEYTWPELKMLITETFPDTFDFASTLHLLVDRKKRPNETVTQYFFSKMYLMEYCKISGPNAVSCLIDGLSDPILQNQAKKCNFLSPETLYSQFLIRIPNFGITQLSQQEPVSDIEFGDNDVLYDQQKQKPKKSERDTSKKKCFSCGKYGHIAEQCRHPPICYRCKKQGHVANKCSHQKTKF